MTGVIFDLDGTLVDTNAFHVEAWHEAFRQLGHDVPRSRIVVEIGKGGDKLVPSILGEAGEARDGEALREAHKANFTALAKRTRLRLFPGTEALLAALRRRAIKTAVATSSAKEHVDVVQASCGLQIDRLVTHVVTASDATESKPAPDLVQTAIARLAVGPNHTVMVGDTPYDGEACRRAGVGFLGVLCGGVSAATLRDAGGRAIYADPADLLRRLDLILRASRSRSQ
jgi:HAD superfamily hydrolase (TIGR01509 family)